MAYEIIETCIGCTACVNRCPTNAITGERKLLHVIDPELCIDCGACEPECPVNAIFPEDAVPAEHTQYIELNARWFKDKESTRKFVDEWKPPA